MQLTTSAQERTTLELWCRRDDRRLALRATLILALADGASNEAVAARFGVSNQTVGKWRARFQRRRLEGLLDDPRSGAPRRIGEDDVKRVLTLTSSPPPPGVPRWTTRLLARTCGLSQTAVSRIWRSHGLSPRAAAAARGRGVAPAGPDGTAPDGTTADGGPLPPGSLDAPWLTELGGGKGGRPARQGVDDVQLELSEIVVWLRRTAATVEAGDHDSLRSAVEVLQAAHAALSVSSRMNGHAKVALFHEARRKARWVLERARRAVDRSQQVRNSAVARGTVGPMPGDGLPVRCGACGRQLRLSYTADPLRPLTTATLACPGCHEPMEVPCPDGTTDLRLE